MPHRALTHKQRASCIVTKLYMSFATLVHYRRNTEETVHSEHHCTAGHGFANRGLLFPFKCTLFNASIEREFCK